MAVRGGGGGGGGGGGVLRAGYTPSPPSNETLATLARAAAPPTRPRERRAAFPQPARVRRPPAHLHRLAAGSAGGSLCACGGHIRCPLRGSRTPLARGAAPGAQLTAPILESRLRSILALYVVRQCPAVAWRRGVSCALWRSRGCSCCGCAGLLCCPPGGTNTQNSVETHNVMKKVRWPKMELYRKTEFGN